MKELPYQLPNELAKDYEIVGDQVVAHFPGFGLIDLRKITAAQAEDLIANGFPALKLKTKSKPKDKE
jgi:hypothetical protein